MKLDVEERSVPIETRGFGWMKGGFQPPKISSISLMLSSEKVVLKSHSSTACKSSNRLVATSFATLTYSEVALLAIRAKF